MTRSNRSGRTRAPQGAAHLRQAPRRAFLPFLSAAAVGAVLLGVPCRPQPAAAAVESIVSGEDAAATVAVTALRVENGTVSAVLVSNSPSVLRHVELLIRYVWLWNDERHPGEDNPGRADYFTVPGQIAPHGRLPFRYRPAVPLPDRHDGRFHTAVEVVGFTEVGR